MLWNRKTKRLKVIRVQNKVMTLEQTVEWLKKNLPEIKMNEKVMDHEWGLLSCILPAKSVREACTRIENYIKGVYKFYDQLQKDKEEHKKGLHKDQPASTEDSGFSELQETSSEG